MQTHTDTHLHSQTLTDTHRHSRTLTGTYRNSQTLKDTHRHSKTLADTHWHSHTLEHTLTLTDSNRITNTTYEKTLSRTWSCSSAPPLRLISSYYYFLVIKL